MFKIVELTEQNESNYLNQVAQLEEIVLEQMKKDGRDGQLFITGKEDISSYIHSKDNTVVVATDTNDRVIAATYITQGQMPFTYNDITKYFKYGPDYQNYIRSSYDSDLFYYKDLLDVYRCKLQAFAFARDQVMSEHSEFKDFSDFINHELYENGFHEKSELREKINQYMSQYIAEHFSEDIQDKYEKFYWITANDIAAYFGRDVSYASGDIEDYEKYLSSQYAEFLQNGPLTIYEEPSFDISKYYSANTKNSIELDTYITSPDSRSSGIARIIVFEGIKKHMQKHFANPENTEIYLCSTLHRDNLSSKYVSEFFGLRDSLFVNRRQHRDREVHICKISREEAPQYLSDISDKLAVLYEYNPSGKTISDDTKKHVLQEQLDYEEAEFDRLTRARTLGQGFKGNLKFIDSKSKKIEKLEEKLKNLTNQISSSHYSELDDITSKPNNPNVDYQNKEGEDYGEL